MSLSEELLNNCNHNTLHSARRLVIDKMVRVASAECQSDSLIAIKGKTVDDFNFVNHPVIIINSAKGELSGFRCDCRAAIDSLVMCVHCAALAMVYGDSREGVGDSEKFCLDDSAPAIDFQPVPKPESEAVAEPDTDKQATSVSMEILFGYRIDDNNQVIWYPNDTERVFHTNMGVIGTMGTGKTQFTKSLVTQLYRQRKNNYANLPLSVLIFDYKGDYNETKEDFCQIVNANILKPYRLPFNPLALNQHRSFRAVLPVHTANAFVDMLAKIYSLGANQKQILFDCILAAYEKQGISRGDPATWSRPAPTFEMVYQEFTRVNKGKDYKSLSAAMNKLHQFCLFEERPNAAKLLSQVLNGVVVIDLSNYDNDIQTLIVEITLEQFYGQMYAAGSSKTDGRFRQLRYVILVDEADNIMSKGFPSLKKIMKEGREFGVGIILSTQSLTHFISDRDDYSRYILTWVVHNVSDLKQRDVEYIFKLRPKSSDIERYYSEIKGLSKHESVVKLSNDDPVRIIDKAFWQLVSE